MAKLITPPAILSYPFLFKPQKNDKGDDIYSCVLVFCKGTDMTALNNAAREAAREEWGDKGEDFFRKQKHPIFRTDEEKGYPEGSIFVRVKTKEKPEIVGRYKGADGKPIAITDPAEIYAGCMVKASVNAAAYDHPTTGKGVSFWLGNIQKVGEGTRLDGRRKAADEFDGEEAPAADDLL